jgi:hypothetical protein
MKQMGAETQYMEQFALQTQDRLEFSNSLENPEKAVVLAQCERNCGSERCGGFAESGVNVFRPE